MTNAVDLIRLADSRLDRLAHALPIAEHNMAMVAADGWPTQTPGAAPPTYTPTTRPVNVDEQCDLTSVEAAVVGRRAAADHDELVRALGRVHEWLDVVDRIVERHVPVEPAQLCTGGSGREGVEYWGAPDRCGDPCERGSVLCPRHRKAEYRWKARRARAIDTTSTEVQT